MVKTYNRILLFKTFAPVYISKGKEASKGIAAATLALAYLSKISKHIRNKKLTKAFSLHENSSLWMLHMNVSDAVESYKKLKDQHTNDSSSQDIVSTLKNTDGVDLSDEEIKKIQNLIWIIQLSYIV